MDPRLLLLLPAVSFAHSTAADVSPSPAVTSPACKELYLDRDVIYVFENTVEDFQQPSVLSAGFLDVLIRQAQSDLINSQKQSPYSTFAIVPFPSPEEICIGISCNFGEVNFYAIPSFTESFTLSARMLVIQPTTDGVNNGLIFSQTLTHNSYRNETIVLFANNELGVEEARNTVQNLRYYMDVETIVVSVGGSYNLTSLTAPGTSIHYLNTSTNWYQLAGEIVSAMGELNLELCVSGDDVGSLIQRTPQVGLGSTVRAVELSHHHIPCPIVPFSVKATGPMLNGLVTSFTSEKAFHYCSLTSLLLSLFFLLSLLSS